MKNITKNFHKHRKRTCRNVGYHQNTKPLNYRHRRGRRIPNQWHKPERCIFRDRKHTESQLNQEIKKEIKIFLELNENENKTQEKFCESLKAALRGKFAALSVCIKENNCLNGATPKNWKNQLKPSRRQEIIKIKERETKKIHRINESKSWLPEKTHQSLLGPTNKSERQWKSKRVSVWGFEGYQINN